jgi:DNA-binding HxlR family transcriptional regulator
MTPTESACSIERSLSIVGERWTLLILRDAFRGLRRFDHFCGDLGISRNLLVNRLQKLVDNGILEKRLYQTRPRRYEYWLTPKGVDLSPALVALMHWGDKHLSDTSGPPLVLTHARCGEPLHQELVCPSCAQKIPPGSIRSRRGPGAVTVDR